MSPQVSSLATTTREFTRLSLDLVDRPQLEQQIEKDLKQTNLKRPETNQIEKARKNLKSSKQIN